jgi:3-oxoacyl-[acyl-carrier protein] reductase
VLTTPTLTSDLLKGQVAIVTGAGRGIGLATAEALAANGAQVVVADIDDECVRAAVSGIGGAATPFVGDLTAPETPDRLISVAASVGGSIDIIVNGAGYFWDAPIHKMTDEQFQAMLDIHLVAPFRICRAAAPYFRDAGTVEAAKGIERHRKIVMVTSVAASFGNVGAANYSAAKAGVIGLTKTLATEWGPSNVNVNAVAFGVIQTRLAAPRSAQHTVKVGGREVLLGVPDQVLQRMGLDPDDAADTYSARMIPGPVLGCTGTIQEAADAILWLASPLSNFVTGQVISVTGGVRGGYA